MRKYKNIAALVCRKYDGNFIASNGLLSFRTMVTVLFVNVTLPCQKFIQLSCEIDSLSYLEHKTTYYLRKNFAVNDEVNDAVSYSDCSK